MPRPMAARPRLVPLLLAASLVALAPPAARAADAPAAAPPEDGVVVLPEANIVQALVGDLDADGQRELMRLTTNVDGATYLEVWHLKGSAWGRIGEPLRLLAGTAGPDLNRVYGGAPARLIAWNDGEGERVLLLTQPRFEELGAAPPCCALLHDVRIERGGVTTESIGDASNSVDALLALDLDGDGRDELLATRSLRPLGDISFPMEARVYRYDGEGFGPPIVAELPFGSGDTPFILGETDGAPGDEAAIISTLGPPGLFRLALGAGDVLGMEPAQFPRATAAAAVPLVEGPGIVVVEGGRQAVLARWPAGDVPEPIATSLAPGDLLGVAETARGARILLAEEIPSKVHVLGPDLRFAPGPSLRETAAVAQLAARGMASYAGELPGGGLDGRPALVYGGRLVGALPAGHAGPRYDVGTIASFAGAAPVGIAGDGSWMAVMHAQFGVERLARHGGRIDEPRPHAGGWMTIAPLDEVLSPEGGSSAAVEPPTIGLSDGPNAGSMFAGGNGFSAEIAAPAGSVVVVVGSDPSSAAEAARRVIPEAGQARVAFPPPPGANPRYRPGAVVLTPAGHGYIASWEVQVLNEPPRVSVQATTPFGSANVALTGTVRPRSQVTIAGRPVEVEPDGSFSASLPAPPWPTDVVIAAVDPVGNEATQRLDVVGFLDYRGLPWIPLVAVIPAVAAAVLFLRAPRPRPRGPEPADDAALEELEPDEQPG